MPNTDKALADLAAKLGVSAQYLWQALMAQQRIEGIIYVLLLLGIFLLIAGIVVTVYMKNRNDEYLKDETVWVGIIGACVYTPIFIGLGYWSLTDLLNPAYASLYEIMQHIK